MDGIVLAHELTYSTYKSGKDGMLLKLDISKAYGRVNYNFLMLMMRKFGFHEDWRALVFECISYTSFLDLINGVAVRYFLGKIGLW